MIRRRSVIIYRSRQGIDMKAMIRWMALTLLWLCDSATAFSGVSGPSLTLSQSNGIIFVVLANLGDQPIKVRRYHSLDRAMGSLSFDIRRGGKVFPEVAHIIPAIPEENTYIVLEPGEIHGVVFDRWLIKSMHGMGDGCYSVSATYEDRFAERFSAFASGVKSNEIKVCMNGEKPPK